MRRLILRTPQRRRVESESGDSEEPSTPKPRDNPSFSCTDSESGLLRGRRLLRLSDVKKSRLDALSKRRRLRRESSKTVAAESSSEESEPTTPPAKKRKSKARHSDSAFYAQVTQIMDSRDACREASLVNVKGREFPVYLEFLVRAFVEYGTSKSAVSAVDDPVMEWVVNKIEKERLTRRNSALRQWPNAVRETVERFSFCNVVPLRGGEADKCGACNRESKKTQSQLVVSGFEYDPSRMSGDQAVREFYRVTQYRTLRDERTEEGIRNFDVIRIAVGPSCAGHLREYHILHHWKFNLFLRVYVWLRNRRARWSDLDEAIALLRADTAFVQDQEDAHRRIFDINAALYQQDEATQQESNEESEELDSGIEDEEDEYVEEAETIESAGELGSPSDPPHDGISGFNLYVELIVRGFVADATGELARPGDWSGHEATARGIDARIRLQKAATAGDWSAELTALVETFPHPISFGQVIRGGRCAGCLHHAETREVTLRGFVYDSNELFANGSVERQVREFFRATGNRRFDDSLSRLSQPTQSSRCVTLGLCCSQQINDFHILTQWKFHLFTRIYKWLSANASMWNSVDEALTLLRSDREFLATNTRSHSGVLRINNSRYPIR